MSLNITHDKSDVDLIQAKSKHLEIIKCKELKEEHKIRYNLS